MQKLASTLSYLGTSKKAWALAVGLAAHAHAATLGVNPALVFWGTLATVAGIAVADFGKFAKGGQP